MWFAPNRAESLEKETQMRRQAIMELRARLTAGIKRTNARNTSTGSSSSSSTSTSHAHAGGSATLEAGSSELAEMEAPSSAQKPASATARALQAATAAVLGIAGGTVAYTEYRYQGEDGLRSLRHKAEQRDGVFGQALRGYCDVREFAHSWVKHFAEPSHPQLLPPLLPEHSYVRTLVLDLDGVLVHSDWNRKRGWRTFKRPGVEEFLQHMSQYFEVVLYTHQLQTYGEPIMERLDPHRCVAHRLYRDATHYTRGVHARDLSRLNRDLRKVVYVTADKDTAFLQPENALIIRSWGEEQNMDPKDTTLLDLMPFLESIIRFNVRDTREVVQSYRNEQERSGKDPPTIFKERMQEYKRKLHKQRGESRTRMLRTFPRSGASGPVDGSTEGRAETESR